MVFKRKVLLLAIVAGLAVAIALPSTRDDMAWFWAMLQNDPGSYEFYFTERPNGLHVADARQCYQDLVWDQTKRALIADAVKKHLAEPGDEAKKERKARMEVVWWHQVTNANTVFGYTDYMHRYPNGRFVEQALGRISILNSQSPTEANSTPSAPSETR